MNAAHFCYDQRERRYVVTLRSWLPLAVLLWSVLVGCAGPSDHLPATTEKAITTTEGVLQGSVTYRERVALPAGAVVEVWITDVSPRIVAVPVVADTTILPEGRQVPIPFQLVY